VVKPEIRSMVDPFVDLCLRTGVTSIKEWGTTPEAYRASMYRMFYMGRNEHLAFGKKLTVLSPDTSLLSPANQSRLNDGIRGGHDPEYNWVSFPGKDLDVVIDLDKPTMVQHIECAFYQRALWLSMFPVKVEFFVSSDGKKFEPVSTVENTMPIDQWDSFERDFIGDFKPREARYVRVIAKSMGNTPGEHPGAGRPARMHIDEIVVE
jgi:hexosaminidase